MGWARTLLLGDIGNHLDIQDANRSIAQTEQGIESIRSELSKARQLNYSQDKGIQQLQRENESLELCLATLIRTLESKGVLTHEEVEKLVAKIDPNQTAAQASETRGGATRVGEAQ